MPIRFFRILSLFFALSVLSGCGHTPVVETAPTLGSRAADQALNMVGKPYRYGGNTPRGFDCSGLVQYSYSRVGVKLPHGTRSLLRMSRPISRSKLRRGDLVFFNQEGKKSSHVALYLGNGRFVHSPSSGKNVYVAAFDDPYWQRHFAEARRLEID
ncbi:MAG: C40 family peptidase [Gammaproteobacteria bacterium]|nr:C40 family peptidase [Gammaproteobacteria bacterium]